MKQYQIDLYYGYEEGECGIYHSFRAADPDVPEDADRIAADLAGNLDCAPSDDRWKKDTESGYYFNWNCMYIDLPESLVERIRSEAISEYRESVGNGKWIPVTERLPEQKINPYTLDFEYVLCMTSFGDVRPYRYGKLVGSDGAHFLSGNGYSDLYVTHWMPMPEPYKKEAL